MTRLTPKHRRWCEVRVLLEQDSGARYDRSLLALRTQPPRASDSLDGIGRRARPAGADRVALEIITRAHLLIYAEHRRLVDAGLASDTSRELLSESSRVVLERAPEAARPAQALAQDRALRQLLEPEGETDDEAFDQAARRAEGSLVILLRRRQAIVDEMAELRGRKPKR